MKVSASHHLSIICIAQLRAKMCEKDSREAWRSSKIMKILIFRIPQNFNIFKMFRILLPTTYQIKAIPEEF